MKDTVPEFNLDRYIGKQLKHRRRFIRMSQQQLAEQVGVRFQQIHKYETGINKISASRLWQLAKALEVEVAHFYDGYQPV